MSQSSSKFAATAEESNILAVDPRDIMSQGYGLAPQMLFRDERLSCHAKAIYGYLSSFAGGGLAAFPSRDLILSELGMSRPTFDKHLKQLEAYGYVRVRHRRSRAGCRMTNLYELVRAPQVDEARMARYIEATARAAARERERYAARSEAAGDIMEKAVRIAHEMMADMFGIEVSAGEIAAAGTGCAPMENGTVPMEDSGGEEQGQNFFALVPNGEVPQGQRSFALAEQQARSLPNKGKGSLPLNIINGNSINQSIPQSHSPEENAPVENSVESPSPSALAAAGGRDGGMDGEDLSEMGFARLLAASIKPASGEVRRKAAQAWAAAVERGYAPADILAAYDAYKRAYFRENSTVKYAKRIDRWLTDSDGLAAYARVADVGPEAAEGAETPEAARERLREAAVLREVRRREAAGSEARAEALAVVDGEFRALRDAARRAHESVGHGGNAERARELWEREMAYLAQHGRVARAALVAQVREEIGGCDE